MSEGLNSPRRRFRIALSLRVLFGVVTASAVVFWFAWDFYPRQTIQPKIEALAAENSDERQLAANRILELGDDAVPFLRRGLKHKNKWVRWEAATLLGRMADADVAVPALIDAMDDTDPDVPKRVALVLGEFGPSAESAVPALTKALQHREEYARVQAARALGLIGPRAAAAEPALTAALGDNSKVARVEAALALWRVSGNEETAVSTLVELLKFGDKRRLVSSEAARALGAMGTAARGSIPALRMLIADGGNVYTSQFAVEALKSIEPAAPAP